MKEPPNRIRELRLEAGLSQQALGDSIGVTKVTISDLERGKMRLDVSYMRRIASALGIEPADLLPCDINSLALSQAERQLIERLRAALPEQRDQLHRVAEVMLPYMAPENSDKD